jgi:hypothetical protein
MRHRSRHQHTAARRRAWHIRRNRQCRISMRRRFSRLCNILIHTPIRRKCANKPFLRFRRPQERSNHLPHQPRPPNARRRRIRNNRPSNPGWTPALPPRGQPKHRHRYWRACSRDNDHCWPHLSCTRFSRRLFASERDWAWATGYNESIATPYQMQYGLMVASTSKSLANKKRKSIPGLPRMRAGCVLKNTCFLISRTESGVFL